MTKCGDVVRVGDDIVEVPVRARKLIFLMFFSGGVCDGFTLVVIR